MKSRDFIGIKVFGGRSQINQARKRVKTEQIQCLRSFSPGGLRRLLTTRTERIYRHPNSNIPKNYQQTFHEMKIYLNFFIAFLWIQFKCDEFHSFFIKNLFSLHLKFLWDARNEIGASSLISLNLFLIFSPHIFTRLFFVSFRAFMLLINCTKRGRNFQARLQFSYLRFFRDFFTTKRIPFSEP